MGLHNCFDIANMDLAGAGETVAKKASELCISYLATLNYRPSSLREVLDLPVEEFERVVAEEVVDSTVAPAAIVAWCSNPR